MFKVTGLIVRILQKHLATVLALASVAMGVITLASSALAQQDVQIREDRPDTYVVVRGDTLWDISGVFLENPAAWPQIWQVNPQIENPDLIYPGDVVALRYVNGRPVLELMRGGEGTGDAIIRLSPAIRSTPLDSGIGIIELSEIEPLLSHNLIIDQVALDESGYVLGNTTGELLAAYLDSVFARGSDWDMNNRALAIIKPQRTFVHPETGEVIGVEVDSIAEAELDEVLPENNIAVIEINSVRREISKNDRVIALSSPGFRSSYSPKVPDIEFTEYVLGLQDGMDYGGKTDSIIITGGTDIGFQVGDLVTLQRPDLALEDEVMDETLMAPGERYGTAMVYKVFGKASFALVLASSGTINVNDKVVRE